MGGARGQPFLFFLKFSTQRTKEVVDTNTFMIGASRVSSISKGTRRKKLGWSPLSCVINSYKQILLICCWLFCMCLNSLWLCVSEQGREWMVCEGFQFILKHQAEALLAMGVCPQFKVCQREHRRAVSRTQIKPSSPGLKHLLYGESLLKR